MMNVALHGLEEAAGVRYQTTGSHAGQVRAGCPIVVRYADDLVVCANFKAQAEQVKAGLAEWLAPGVLCSTRTRRRSCTSPRGSLSWDSTSADIETASC
jgi:RNA-directed DNA polymerase